MKERGMVKWKPFISMVEQQQAVYQVLNELQKIEKPMRVNMSKIHEFY